MTLNWGHKLTIFICAFAGMIIVLVYKATQTNFDLVAKEYYKDELVYQQVIDGTSRANNLSEKPSVSREGATITLQMPAEMHGLAVTGNVWFYNAADAKRDIKLPLSLNSKGQQQISSRLVLPGRYTVKFNWNAGQRQYYSETTIDLR